MVANVILSVSEFASLKEVGKGFDHGSIPEADALRLLDLGLIYNLLGSFRINRAGRLRIASEN
jgi:hypothetical protein